jgi:hypothetical protein
LTAKFAKKGREGREEEHQKYTAFLCALRESFATFAVRFFDRTAPLREKSQKSAAPRL